MGKIRSCRLASCKTRMGSGVMRHVRHKHGALRAFGRPTESHFPWVNKSDLLLQSCRTTITQSRTIYKRFFIYYFQIKIQVSVPWLTEFAWMVEPWKPLLRDRERLLVAENVMSSSLEVWTILWMFVHFIGHCSAFYLKIYLNGYVNIWLVRILHADKVITQQRKLVLNKFHVKSCRCRLPSLSIFSDEMFEFYSSNLLDDVVCLMILAFIFH